MSPLFSRSLAALLALFLSSSSVLADAGGRQETAAAIPAEARTRYEEGVRAFAAGKYADALELFKDADRRSPSAALSFNMARAYAELHDDAGTLASYREYLRRSEKPDDAADVERTVQNLSRRLAARGIQQLTVLSTPPGATVFLDGERIGVTPSTSEARPGVHALSLRLEGYGEETRRVRLPVYDAIDVRVALHESPPPLPAAAAPVPLPTPAPAIPANEAPPPRARPVPRPVSDSPSTPGRPLRTIGVVALAAGGAALGGALTFELMRRDAEQKARNEKEQVRLVEEVDTINSRRTTARVLGGLGAGLAAIGGAFLIASPSAAAPQDRSARVKVDVTASGLTAIVSGRF